MVSPQPLFIPVGPFRFFFLENSRRYSRLKESRCATGVVDTGGAPWLANISSNFSKKLETVLMEYSGAGEKLIHEKNQKQKISWHYPFNAVWSMVRCNYNRLYVYLILSHFRHFRQPSTYTILVCAYTAYATASIKELIIYNMCTGSGTVIRGCLFTQFFKLPLRLIANLNIKRFFQSSDTLFPRIYVRVPCLQPLLYKVYSFINDNIT